MWQLVVSTLLSIIGQFVCLLWCVISETSSNTSTYIYWGRCNELKTNAGATNDLLVYKNYFLVYRKLRNYFMHKCHRFPQKKLEKFEVGNPLSTQYKQILGVFDSPLCSLLAVLLSKNLHENSLPNLRAEFDTKDIPLK